MSAARALAALEIPGVWQGERLRPAGPVAASGIEQLDAALAGGWPLGVLTQIATPHAGLGLSLLMPVLARYSQAGRHVGLVAPPCIPYAPALASAGVALDQLLWIAPANETEALWASEQMLRSGLFAAVLFWTGAIDGKLERRLQLAAQESQCLAIAFRHDAQAAELPSFAALRLALAPRGPELEVRLQKSRSGRAGQAFALPPARGIPLSRWAA